jgi:DNA polymerase III subunit alpha
VDDEGPGRRRVQKVMVAGLAVAINRRKTQRGRMAGVVLDDRTGRIEATLFNEVFEAHQERLAPDRVYVISGGLQYDEFRGGLSLRADHLLEFQQARELYVRHLLLHLDSRGLDAPARQRLQQELGALLNAFRNGPCPLKLAYQGDAAEALLELGPAWRLFPTDELVRRLEQLPGANGLEFSYRRPVLPEAPARGGYSARDEE